MILRSVRFQVSVVCLVLLCAGQNVAGSTVLLRTASKLAPELGPIQTYAGAVDPVISPVKPGASVTVVLLMDSLGPAEMESIKKDLPALYQALRGHPLRLALLRNGSIGVAGPFSSRAQLKSALNEVIPTTDSVASVGSPATPPPALLDNLYAGIAQLGSDWSRVLLVGEFPPLEAASREYALSVLLRGFGSAHLQVSWYAFSGGNDAWVPLFASTGGNIVHGTLIDFAAMRNDASQFYFEVDWTAAAPSSGFVVSRSVLSDKQNQVILDAPDVTASSGAALPSIERYTAMRAKLSEAAPLLAQEAITETDAKSIREELQAALEINPLDPDSLLDAALFYEKLKDFATAAQYRASLTEVRPLDAAGYAALGHVLVESANFGAAEKPLQRAFELNLRTPQMAEDLARIRLANKDDKGAMPFLAEALQGDEKRQDLQFMQAQAAQRLKDFSLAIRSFQQGLALGGTHIVEVTSLAHLYIATDQRPQSSRNVRGESGRFATDERGPAGLATRTRSSGEFRPRAFSDRTDPACFRRCGRCGASREYRPGGSSEVRGTVHRQSGCFGERRQALQRAKRLGGGCGQCTGSRFALPLGKYRGHLRGFGCRCLRCACRGIGFVIRAEGWRAGAGLCGLSAGRGFQAC
jgi:tetratricopeptide (TPR) repeat protein